MSSLDAWEMLEMIGKGAFAKVYRARNESSGEDIAVKVASTPLAIRFLRTERDVYTALGNCNSAARHARIKFFEEQDGKAYLGMTLLGASLMKIFLDSKTDIFLEDSIPIAIMAVELLQGIHELGYLHGDLKMDNLVLGRADNCNTLYMIDFGNSHNYKDDMFGEIAIDLERAKKPKRSKLRYENSRRGDLVSLFFVIVDSFALKECECSSKEDMTHLLYHERNVEIPTVFLWFIQYCESLDIGVTPDYEQILSQFKHALMEFGGSEPAKLSWFVDGRGMEAGPISEEKNECENTEKE